MIKRFYNAYKHINKIQHIQINTSHPLSKHITKYNAYHITSSHPPSKYISKN